MMRKMLQMLQKAKNTVFLGVDLYLFNNFPLEALRNNITMALLQTQVDRVPSFSC